MLFGQREGRWVVLSVPHAPTSAPMARLSMRTALAPSLSPELIGDAELVLGELVANAVEHGRPNRSGLIEAAWLLTADELVVRVRDSGPCPPLSAGLPHDGSTDLAARGRGLLIVDELSDGWWSSAYRGGTEVRAVLGRWRTF